MKTNTSIVKRLRQYNFLVKKGIYPIETLADKDNPKFNVWIFEKTDKFYYALEEYKVQQDKYFNGIGIEN